MANIMSLKSLRNKTSRNGFDLSTKRNFTSKAGELLPVLCMEILPDDNFKIDLKSFTRTQPINTAAFARMREYYDFSLFLMIYFGTRRILPLPKCMITRNMLYLWILLDRLL